MKDTIRFSRAIATTEIGTLQKQILYAGVVRNIKVRLYQGCRLNLRLNVYVLRKNDVVELLKTAGKGYIDGDDDYLDYNVSVPVFPNDIICVDYANVGANTYDFAVSFELEVGYSGE